MMKLYFSVNDDLDDHANDADDEKEENDDKTLNTREGVR